MNKEGVIIFLDSDQDPSGSSSNFSNSLPKCNLTSSKEMALTEIILPDDYFPKLARDFPFFIVRGLSQEPHLTVKLGYYPTTQALADHLNSQIHDVLTMRGENHKISHLVFSVSKDDCLVAKPWKQTIPSISNNEPYLGLLDNAAATEFATLTGFDMDDIEDLFTLNPYREIEATKHPNIIISPLVGIEINLLGRKYLKLLPAGQKHVIVKNRVYHPIKSGRYTSINIKVMDPRSRQLLSFERGATVAVLHMREANIVNG